jgi:cytochrome c5
MRQLHKATGSQLRPLTPAETCHRWQHGLYGLLLALIAALPFVVCSNTALTAEGPASDRRSGVTASEKNAQPVDAETSPTAEEYRPAGADATETSLDRYDLALGKSVFHHTCLTCHGTSVRDAPRVGDMHAWQPRLAQGLDVLIRHALEGHGRMPAKGGYGTLSDAEVSAAVAYVYRMGTGILARQEAPDTQAGCDPVSNPDQCTPAQLKRLLVLQMLWLLGGPRQ